MLPTVLVVEVDAAAREALATAIAPLHCVVVTAASFEEARSTLIGLEPAVAIAPVKLREYNSLHLALTIRVRALQTQMIILGYADAVIEREAAAAGATYLVNPDLDAGVAAVAAALSRVTRKWPRARVAIDAAAGDVQVRILDVSYGGLRLESHSIDFPLNRPLPVLVGRLRVDATPIWARRDEEDEDTCFYGATLAVTAESAREWQALVDAALRGSPA